MIGVRIAPARLGGWLTVCLGAVALCWLFYVAAMNAFLSTSLFDRVINADPLLLEVRYAHGWSLWPGDIRAKNLSIRSRDGNVEWLLTIDQVQFHVSLLRLAERRFDVSEVHGVGVSFRMRNRISAGEITPQQAETVDRLPPIPGFRQLPLRPFRVCSFAEWDDARYDLWTVRLANVVAERVREVWIDHHRLQDVATVTGGFFLKPMRAAYVGPADVTLHIASVRTGDESEVERTTGMVNVRVAEFDPRTFSGDDILHRTSAALHLGMEGVHLENLPLTFNDAKLAGTVKVDELRLIVSDGTVRSPSELKANSPAIEFISGKHALAGAVSVDTRVAKRNAEESIELAATVQDARFDSDLVAVPVLTLAGTASGLDLSRPVRDITFDARAHDLRFAWRAGAIDAQGRGEALAHWTLSRSTPVGTGTLEVNLSSAGLRWRHARLAGSVHAIARANGVVAGTDDMDIAGTRLVLDNLQATGQTPSLSKVDAELLTGRVGIGKGASFEGRVNMDASDVNPFLALLLQNGPNASMQNVLSHLLGLNALPHLVGSAQIMVDSERFGIDPVDVRGGDLAAHGVYASRGPLQRAAFIVAKGPVSVGLGLGEGGWYLQLFGLDEWAEREERHVAELLAHRTGIASSQPASPRALW